MAKTKKLTYAQLCLENARRREYEQQLLEGEKAYQQSLEEEQQAAIRDKIYAIKFKNNNATGAKDNIKRALLYEFFDYIMKRSLQEQEADDPSNLRHYFINEYFKEKNLYNILVEMKTKSLFLSHSWKCINESCNAIYEAKKCKKDEGEELDFKLEDEELDDFIESLDKELSDNIVSAIADRVQRAVADMIFYNKEDKAAINKIIADTQEKIDKTVNESLINDYSSICNGRIKDIKNRRYKTVLEHLVLSLGKQSLLNEDVKKELASDDKVDFEKVLESARVIYTFMEMMNTLKLQKLDENFIIQTCKDFE